MIQTSKVAGDIDVLASSVTVPGLGTVPVNAFVLHGEEPILVDTGMVVDRDDFLEVLTSVINPAKLRWIYLTHPDPDHIGALTALVTAHPQIRVITTFLGVGILSLMSPLPMDQVYLLNPEQTVTLGDRTLTAVKPPAFDNPATTGFFESRSRAFFSSDCFGAVLDAVPESAADLAPADLRRCQVRWATIDSPWLHSVDRRLFARALDRVRAMEPSVVLSSHLPPATGRLLPPMLDALAAAPEAERFVGPDQAALEQMLQQPAQGG